MSNLTGKIELFNDIENIDDAAYRLNLKFSVDKYIQYEYGSFIDWHRMISAYDDIGSDILDINSKYFKDKTWKLISRSCKLELWFIEKYKINLDIRRVYSKHKCNITEEFIENNTDLISIEEAICLVNVSEEFIEKHMDILSRSMCNVIKYNNLSMSFINKYINIIDMNYVSIYQALDEKFIEKHAEVINWDNVSIYQKLSYEFIERHIDKIRIYYYIRSNNHQAAFLFEKYKDKLSKFEINSLRAILLT